MQLFFNELSIHDQFDSLDRFRDSIGTVMSMRSLARNHNRELYCKISLSLLGAGPLGTVQQFLNGMPPSERTAVFQWLGKSGPYWEHEECHDRGEWYEHENEIITDSSLAEATKRIRNGVDARMVSLCPSKFEESPLSVVFKESSQEDLPLRIQNYWMREQLESALSIADPAPRSWAEMADRAEARFTSLRFATNWTEGLRGQPFIPASAERMLERLATLHRIKSSFDMSGNMTDEGERLHKEHLQGSGSHFSDSSDTEKRDFKNQLTFPNPDGADSPLFCPWHAKVSTGVFRIHFTFPISHDKDLVVVYAGPKITKR